MKTMIVHVLNTNVIFFKPYADVPATVLIELPQKA